MKISVYLFDEADQPFFLQTNIPLFFLLACWSYLRKQFTNVGNSFSAVLSKHPFIPVICLFYWFYMVPINSIQSVMNVPSVGFSSVLLYIRFPAFSWLVVAAVWQAVSITEQFPTSDNIFSRFMRSTPSTAFIYYELYRKQPNRSSKTNLEQLGINSW